MSVDSLIRRRPRFDDRQSAILVIGLGRFGSAVAQSLVRLGHEVLAVDIDAEHVQAMSDVLPNVLQADFSQMETLEQLGAGDFGHVVVAIGAHLEASVLVTLNLAQAGVRDIWVKANSPAHGRIVERLGAHHVIFPEADMGERVAHMVTGKMIDFIAFEDGFAIAKTRAPGEAAGRTLAECGFRQKYGVTVVGVKRMQQDFIYGRPETRIEAGDLLIVAGTTRDVERFAAVT